MQRQFLNPGRFVDAGDGVELLGTEVKAGPVQVLVAGADAGTVLFPLAAAFDPVDHPRQHAHVFAITRPDKFAVFAFAEPVGGVDLRQFATHGLQLFAHVQPMLEIVAHVVANEGQHGKRVAPHHAGLAGGGCRCFGTHGGRHVDTFNPVARLSHQWHGGRAATAEDEGVDGHAFRVVPGFVKRRVVGGSDGKARIRVCGPGAGFFRDLRRPVIALPVDQVRRQRLARCVMLHAFPPDVAVVGQRNVGENCVVVQAAHAVRVGQQVGARCHAKVASLGVDGV